MCLSYTERNFGKRNIEIESDGQLPLLVSRVPTLVIGRPSERHPLTYGAVYRPLGQRMSPRRSSDDQRWNSAYQKRRLSVCYDFGDPHSKISLRVPIKIILEIMCFRVIKVKVSSNLLVFSFFKLDYFMILSISCNINNTFLSFSIKELYKFNN